MIEHRYRQVWHAALVVTLVIFALVPVDRAAATEPGAQEIMEKNFFVSKLKSLRAESSMALINDRGQKRERNSSNILKLQQNGVDSRFLVKFSAPSDIRGTTFLQVEHSEGDDDLWIYLPALKKSRRLVANNKKDSFVGSDFSYGDILLPKVPLYLHTLAGSETVDGHDCYVVESVPASDRVKSDSGYSKKVTWVRKDNFLETRVMYYDLSGRLLKTQLVTGHELLEPDTQRWIARQREMSNHQTGHKTVLRFDKVEPGVALADDLFTTRYLERE
jgi:outer membrane lipoprotein-sorting protein